MGISGTLGLIGPLGIEAYARVTPAPVLIVDARATLAFHVGPVALTGGWRELSVHRSGDLQTPFAFSGPQVGLALQF